MSTAAIPAAQRQMHGGLEAAGTTAAQAVPEQAQHGAQALDAAFKDIDLLIWQSLSDTHKQNLVNFCVGAAAITRAAFLEEILKPLDIEVAVAQPSTAYDQEAV